MKTFGRSFTAALLGALLLAAVGTGVAAAASLPAASTGGVSSVHPTSVVVNGTITPNGATTTWYFEYGTTTSYGSKTAVNTVTSGSGSVGVSSTLAGLSPSTSYDYRLVATNRVGSTVGVNAIFITSQVPDVITSSANNLSSTAATLNGIVNPEGQTTNWYFQYGLTTAYGMKTPAKLLAASPNQSNESATISSLAPHSTYHFRLVATSGAGTSVGSDVTFTTGLSVTLNAPTGSVVYGSSVLLTGTIASGAAGVQVVIESEKFDQTTFTNLATVTTGSGGAWSSSVQPAVRTTYEAAANGGTSSSATISVQPSISLSSSRPGVLVTGVTAGMSFATHIVRLQMLTNDRWIAIKLLRLNAIGRNAFSTKLVPPGRRVIRISIGTTIPGVDQAGPGYLAGISRSIAVG